MKAMFIVLFTGLFSAISYAAELPAACQNLLAEVKQSQTDLREVTRVYQCGPKVKHIGGERIAKLDACLIYYNVPRKPQNNWEIDPTIEVSAYHDAPNNFKFLRFDELQREWTGEKFRCNDVVKDIIAENTKAPVITAELRYQTEQFYCPFTKTYIHYKVDCEQISPDPSTTWPPKEDLPPQAEPSKKPRIPPQGTCEKISVTGGPKNNFFAYRSPDDYYLGGRPEFYAVGLMKPKATYWVMRKSGLFLLLEGSANNLQSFWVHKEQVECL